MRSSRLIAGAIVAVLAGCTQSAPTPPLSAPTVQSPATSAPSDSPAVEILSWDQTQKRLAEFRGKVVVLDVWSTYCDPCVREFPNLVALQKRFGDKIRCISFDTDYAGAVNQGPESFRKLVLAFLTKQKANELLNVISSDASEDFYNRIHLGGPPAVFVYDPSGKQVHRFDNSHSPPEFIYQRDVVPLVEKLLAEQR